TLNKFGNPLWVLPIAKDTISATIGENQAYDFNGRMLTIAGTYVDTLTAANGCDSIVTLNLTVMDSQPITCTQAYYTTADALVACRQPADDAQNNSNKGTGTYIVSDIWTWDGIPGIERFYINFDLSDFNLTSNAHITNADLYLFGIGFRGNSSNTATNKHIFNRVNQSWGEYTITWNNQPTIDASTSVITPQIPGTMNNPAYWVDYVFNMNNILLNNGYLYSDYQGISCRPYQENVNNYYRCMAFASKEYPDSTKHPILKVKYEIPMPKINFDCNTFYISQNEDLNVLFDNVQYLWTINGVEYAGDTIYTNLTGNSDISLHIKITNNVGEVCDYFITENNFLPVINNTISDSICENEIYNFNGRLLNQAGVYSDTLTNINDCDSIVTLTLSVLPNSTFAYSEVICEGYTYDFNGKTLNTSGIYIDTLTSRLGCDSIITLTLTISSNNNLFDTLVICANELPYAYADTIFQEGTLSGIYQLNDICSGITLKLDILPKINTLAAVIPRICADDTNFILQFPPSYSPNDRFPTNFKITFSDKALAAGFQNFEGNFGSGDVIIVDLPTKVYPDKYSFTIILSDSAKACNSLTSEYQFAVLYPETIMEQKWDDVIALKNKKYNGGFDFAGFQWLQNGYYLQGETRSYIYLGPVNTLTVGDEYSVLITRPDGSQMLSCPFIAREARPTFRYYPIVSQHNNVIQINYNTTQSTRVRLWTATGVLLRSERLNTPEHTMAARTGMYLVEILADDLSERLASFTIVVE
ncbi:MAG: DNRLRE domain-containing protein, partial [Paludibacter sp.]|nr:DNRLRE domain-containing protein [Paludibacter sp.]